MTLWARFVVDFRRGCFAGLMAGILFTVWLLIAAFVPAIPNGLFLTELAHSIGFAFFFGILISTMGRITLP